MKHLFRAAVLAALLSLWQALAETHSALTRARLDVLRARADGEAIRRDAAAYVRQIAAHVEDAKKADAEIRRLAARTWEAECAMEDAKRERVPFAEAYAARTRADLETERHAREAAETARAAAVVDAYAEQAEHAATRDALGLAVGREEKLLVAQARARAAVLAWVDDAEGDPDGELIDAVCRAHGVLSAKGEGRQLRLRDALAPLGEEGLADAAERLRAQSGDVGKLLGQAIEAAGSYMEAGDLVDAVRAMETKIGEVEGERDHLARERDVAGDAADARAAALSSALTTEREQHAATAGRLERLRARAWEVARGSGTHRMVDELEGPPPEAREEATGPAISDVPGEHILEEGRHYPVAAQEMRERTER